MFLLVYIMLIVGIAIQMNSQAGDAGDGFFKIDQLMFDQHPNELLASQDLHTLYRRGEISQNQRDYVNRVQGFGGYATAKQYLITEQSHWYEMHVPLVIDCLTQLITAVLCQPD